MKFCKKYQEYMNGQGSKKLPGVGLKQLKKILKRCRKDLHSHHEICTSQECPVCDGSFFPSLLKEMSQVVGTFNQRTQKLLALHLASGFQKYFIWIKGKQHRHHAALIQEGKDLVTYALINAIAIRKILKKYDKVHYSKQGQAFKSQAQSMHMEILQSPWLIELMAFHINSRGVKANSANLPAFFEGCSLTIADDKPALSCELFDSVKVDVDLTCSVCLDTVFDSVALSCGHIFCYMCACSAASVTIVDGLKEASPKEKCPLCREVKPYIQSANKVSSLLDDPVVKNIFAQAGLFAEAVHLEELNILLKQNCHEYWEQRLQSERAERIKQAKQHWESQCRAFVGV